MMRVLSIALLLALSPLGEAGGQERGALYRVLPVRIPALAERLAELQQEHVRILEMLRDTIDEARRTETRLTGEIGKKQSLLVGCQEKLKAEQGSVTKPAILNPGSGSADIEQRDGRLGVVFVSDQAGRLIGLQPGHYLAWNAG